MSGSFSSTSLSKRNKIPDLEKENDDFTLDDLQPFSMSPTDSILDRTLTTVYENRKEQRLTAVKKQQFNNGTDSSVEELDRTLTITDEVVTNDKLLKKYQYSPTERNFRRESSLSGICKFDSHQSNMTLNLSLPLSKDMHKKPCVNGDLSLLSHNSKKNSDKRHATNKVQKKYRNTTFHPKTLVSSPCDVKSRSFQIEPMNTPPRKSTGKKKFSLNEFDWENIS